MADIKNYRPESKSLSSGQVLSRPYDNAQAKLIVREMTDLLVLDLVDKGLMTDQIALTVSYDMENLTDPARAAAYGGEVKADYYGRRVPKHAHGSADLGGYTSSTRVITRAMMELFDRVTDPALTVRRLNVAANDLLSEEQAMRETGDGQMDLFSDTAEQLRQKQAREEALAREKRRQKAILAIQKRYGKNALLKGMDLEEGATTQDRNRQIGGHKA